MAKQHIKLVPIKAEQWTGSQEMADKYGIQMNLLGQMWIETSGRKMRLEYGDYIITDTEGKYEVVDGKTFVSTYKGTRDGCKFCKHGDDLSGIPDEEVDMKDMAFCYIGIPRNHGSYVLHYGSPGDGYDGQDYMASINYCPMCGRRLTND